MHPRAKQKLPGGEKVVDARLEEEHEAEKLLAELESLDVDSKEFTGKLTKLRDAVIAHAEHEERRRSSPSSEPSCRNRNSSAWARSPSSRRQSRRPGHIGVESPAANSSSDRSPRCSTVCGT